MLDSSLIPTGEYEVDGTVVRVNRLPYGTVTVHQISPRFRRIGYVTADGRHEGRRLAATLGAVEAGATPVVRCERCQAVLTDETSRARGLGPECAGKLAAEGRAS